MLSNLVCNLYSNLPIWHLTNLVSILYFSSHSTIIASDNNSLHSVKHFQFGLLNQSIRSARLNENSNSKQIIQHSHSLFSNLDISLRHYNDTNHIHLEPNHKLNFKQTSKLNINFLIILTHHNTLIIHQFSTNNYPTHIKSTYNMKHTHTYTNLDNRFQLYSFPNWWLDHCYSC